MTATTKTLLINKQISRQRGFVLPSFSAYGVLFGIIVAMAFALTWSINQTRSIENEYAQYKADVLAQQEALAADAERRRIESERINADVVAGWSAAVAWHRDHPRTVTVRVPADCHPGGMPGLSATSQGTTGLHVGSGEGGLSLSVAQCEDLANDSLMDDAWIRTVKQWVQQQHEVSR